MCYKDGCWKGKWKDKGLTHWSFSYEYLEVHDSLSTPVYAVIGEAKFGFDCKVHSDLMAIESNTPPQHHDTLYKISDLEQRSQTPTILHFLNLFEALKALLHMGSTTDIKTEIKSASLIPFQLLRKENHTFICHVL